MNKINSDRKKPIKVDVAICLTMSKCVNLKTDNYTIKDGCWLCIEEIIDPQTESVRYTGWNLNNVCQYHYYEYEEMYSLYLEFN